MLCPLLYISPSIILWPHSVQGCDAARRSSVQRQTQQQPLRAALAAARHLSPCLCGKAWAWEDMWCSCTFLPHCSWIMPPPLPNPRICSRRPMRRSVGGRSRGRALSSTWSIYCACLDVCSQQWFIVGGLEGKERTMSSLNTNLYLKFYLTFGLWDSFSV